MMPHALLSSNSPSAAPPPPHSLIFMLLERKKTAPKSLIYQKSTNESKSNRGILCKPFFPARMWTFQHKSAPQDKVEGWSVSEEVCLWGAQAEMSSGFQPPPSRIVIFITPHRARCVSRSIRLHYRCSPVNRLIKMPAAVWAPSGRSWFYCTRAEYYQCTAIIVGQPPPTHTRIVLK